MSVINHFCLLLTIFSRVFPCYFWPRLHLKLKSQLNGLHVLPNCQFLHVKSKTSCIIAYTLKLYTLKKTNFQDRYSTLVSKIMCIWVQWPLWEYSYRLSTNVFIWLICILSAGWDYFQCLMGLLSWIIIMIFPLQTQKLICFNKE